MKKRKKYLEVLSVLVLIALIGQKIAFAREELNYDCSGDYHIIPILKDEFRAYTSVSCNGSSNGTANPEFATAVQTCYTDTYVEVSGIWGDFDSDSFSATGPSAFDPVLICWATASVHGAKEARSKHSGGNCYASGLNGSTYWTR